MTLVIIKYKFIWNSPLFGPLTVERVNVVSARYLGREGLAAPVLIKPGCLRRPDSKSGWKRSKSLLLRLHHMGLSAWLHYKELNMGFKAVLPLDEYSPHQHGRLTTSHCTL